MELSNIAWIGGATSSGKTSVADVLASRYRVQVYHADRHAQEHATRFGDERHPVASAWMSRTLDETWVDLPVGELVAQTIAFHRELFELIIEDLRSLVASERVIVEGFQLLPELVAPLLPGPGHAAWLVSTDDFRHELLLRRPHAWMTPARTRDPALAQRHRLERDDAIALYVAAQALALELESVEVDRSNSPEDVLSAVESRLAPFLSS